jgi:hypothetical protein
MTNELKFYEFIYDRHYIWWKRFVQKTPPPWTADPILQKYKFCNMYRELDKGTQYIIERVINTPHHLSVKIFNIYCYRFFNSYGLFENFFEGLLNPEDYDFKHNEELLDKKLASGMKIYSDAYTTCQIPFNEHYRKSNKHIQVLLKLKRLRDLILHENFVQRFVAGETPEQQIQVLREIPTVGPFLAGQIYLDITYTKEISFTGNDFLIIGPGAAEGIKLLAPTLPEKNYEAYILKLQANENYFFDQLITKGKDFRGIRYNSHYQINNNCLSLMNYQHNLCEYRKYLNLSNPERKSKKRYYNSEGKMEVL